jgi:hypothetical protein
MTSPRNDHPPLPPVYFNHLYAVLDDKTYRAIQASDFLRSAFSGVERRVTRTAAGETWTGTYFYGFDNYVEFFGVSAGQHWQPQAEAGWAGLAFSSDQPGGAAAVAQRIEAVFGYTPYSELRQLQTPDKTVNWFYNVRLAESVGLPSFDSFLMEFHPDIFKHKGIDLPPGSPPTRQAYLSPWNIDDPARQSQGAPAPGLRRGAPVFKRVLGATFAIPEAPALAYSAVLEALGYTRREGSDQLTLSAHGFDLVLQTGRPCNECRLVSIQLQMARPSVAPMSFLFAPGSRLVLNEDLTAVWHFGDAAC